VIEDIEGGAPEPTRRPHVVVLSGAVAIASLVLLLTLVVPAPVVPAPVVPARVDTAKYAASPRPSATLGPLMTTVSIALSQLRVDLTRTSACTDGTRLVPPYHLMVDATSGRVIAVVSDPRTDRSAGRSVPVALAWDGGAGYLTVTCATNEDSVPWDKVAR
jgi:hypothetical protein